MAGEAEGGYVSADGSWHHIAVCKVGADFGVYLDGVQTGYGHQESTSLTNVDLIIGALFSNGGYAQYFNGALDEVRISHSNIFNLRPNQDKTDSFLVNPSDIWYKDVDNDGYGDSNSAPLSQCSRPAGYKAPSELTATSGDCDDSNAAVHPGVTEICNGIDDNCNGQTDENGVCGFKCRVDTACLSWETDVLQISSLFNAHAELPTQGNYPYKICCQGPVQLGIDCGATYATPFLNLYSTTNSHVEKATLSNYHNPACISGTLISCAYGSDCGDNACLASISGDTNAHIANCTGGGSYPTKVCCSLNDIVPPSISLDYKGISGNHWVGEGEVVKFIAAASDAGTGVSEIKLYVNSVLKKTCTTSPCEWTSTSGFSAGEAVSFSATAADNAGNNGANSSSFTRCSLGSVAISPYDCSAFGCDQGNKVRISATFSGDTCPSPSYIQVDAVSSDGLCGIEAAPSGNNMTGMSSVCASGTPCYWDIPAVPDGCKNKLMVAKEASVRDTINPSIWRQFGFITNPTGSFTLRGAASGLIKVEASALYVKQGSPVTLYSFTVGGTGDKRLECGMSEGVTDICVGSYAPSNPACTFNSPWPDNGEKTVHCRVFDVGSSLYSDYRTVNLMADNTAPTITWNSPSSPFYRNTGTNRNIAIDASVSDSGAGLVNGANCNPKIDSGISSFTGSVVYSSSAGKCLGTISLNVGGLTEGTHTLTLDVPDNSTAPNTAHSTARQLIVDNTPPKAWIQPPLPVWKNASSGGSVSFGVSWGGADANSPGGVNLSYEVQYAVFDSLNTIWAQGWQPFASSIYNGLSSTYNGSAVFGPDSPINPASYDGRNISFRVKVTDQAGNYVTYERWGTVIDTTPPSCQMGEPYVIASGNKFTRNGFWFVNGRYNVSWAGADSTTPGGIASGAASYDVNIEPGTSGWQDMDTASYCNNTNLTSSMCGIGINGQAYNFSCRSIDAAGNAGLWSAENTSVKVDTEAPMSRFNPLHEWIGRNQSEWMGSEYFNLSWSDNNDDYPGSGVKCFYVKWSNSTTRADLNPAKWWINLTSTYSATDPACLSPANRTYRFGLYRQDTTLKDNEAYNFSIMSVDNIGNAEPFDSWGGEYQSRVKNTTIDRYEPILNSWVKDSSGSIIQPGYLDPHKTTYVNITSNASDNISGIQSNIIYMTIVQKSISNYISTNSSQSDCIGGIWSTLPNGGNRTCTVRVDYADGTTITYNAVATDRANNKNSSTGFVTTHPLANFLVHLVVMTIGSNVDIPLQVRNTEKTTQNLTLGLVGFGMAAFTPSVQLMMIEPCSSVGRCANMTLSPGEDRTIYVRIIANDITNGPVDLNLTAVSSLGVMDNDTASIIIGYPAEFPALDAWWAVLLMMIFAAIVFYRTENIA